jgi:hypothetical protein
MADPGFMIPLNANDYYQFSEGGNRNVCSLANQQTYTQTPWWTNENSQLTGSVDPVTARVGDTVVIQVGVQALVTARGETTPAAIQNVEAWVCYPNTVAGGASDTLVVPSMQNSRFASFSNTTVNAPLVADLGIYQGAACTPISHGSHCHPGPRRRMTFWRARGALLYRRKCGRAC